LSVIVVFRHVYLGGNRYMRVKIVDFDKKRSEGCSL
jgi:hypothetical protein